MGTELHTKTLTQISEGLEQGEFTSVEVTTALLDRIDQKDSGLNSFVTVTAESALAADRR